jgi:UDP-N-acetylmuramoyl-L-alanyl-D-glutamate--2,6-diaminopimelate ligase
MNGAELLHGLPHELVRGQLDSTITGLAYDSRRVTPGTAFIALPGTRVDGHDFAAAAVGLGASLVITGRPVELPGETAIVCVETPRAAMAQLAAQFHGQPSAKLNLIGITGTNGKTTVAFLVRELLRGAGHRCGLIGTVEYDLGDRVIPAARTTPESLELHACFAGMVRAGCKICVMEISSHALAQHRVAGLEFQTTAFTNLTQDHLDYHGDMEKYFAAKQTLFTQQPVDGIRIVNIDSPFGQRLSDKFVATTFGESNSDLQITQLKLGQHQTEFTLAGVNFTMPLIGRHNVSNAAAALGIVRGVGLELADCAPLLAAMPPVPGRLESLRQGQPFAVYVDYAHTGDALRQVLSTLREITPGRLRVLFGCGGNRDTGKRRKMGEAAAALADDILITTDNPRRENPHLIAEQVAEGCPGMGRIELDRARAIDEILREAKAGDTVLIAGKGHETYQEIDDIVMPFDDRQQARAVLAAMNEGH